MMTSKLRFATALLPTGWRSEVAVTIDGDGIIVAVEEGSTAGERVAGLTIPGVPNVHSHAHQRAMAGLAERAGESSNGHAPDSFWTWRQVMYGFLEQMTPDDMEAIAAQLYVEMLKAGFTAVGEFQYLHHGPDGTPYDNPTEMTLRCLEAARRTGIGFTALPVFYGQGGFGGQPPTEGQRRFVSSVGLFLRMVEDLRDELGDRVDASLGIAPHSLRAVTEDSLGRVLAGIDALAPGSPVHIHVAEQEKEVADCLAWCGARPVRWLLDHFEVTERWCAIHVTHLDAEEITDLAATGAVAGLCPTTEANLGDGIFAAPPYLAAGGALAIGTDSHISVSPAEDLRMLEYSQRLRHHQRNVLTDGPGRSTGRSLLDRALAGGARALGRPLGAIAPGYRADFVVLDSDHPALVGRREDTALDSWIFSGGNACVRHVFVGGEAQVKDGHHRHEEEILRRFRSTLDRLAA